MGGAFEHHQSITVTGASGRAQALIPIGFKHGILQQVTVERTAGDATDTGVYLFEQKDSSDDSYYDETDNNSFRILGVATAARTLYNARDYLLKFVSRERTDTSNAGRKFNITVNLDFSGGSAIAQTYKVTVSGIGVS